MHGKFSGARIKQRRAIKAAVDRRPGATELRTNTAARNVGRDAVVG